MTMQATRKATRYEYYIHNAGKPKLRLDGPYTSRKMALACSVKFNESGIPTVIIREVR
jgi:hypothetical protein